MLVKTKAALIHFLISVLIVSISLLLISKLYYPRGFFELTGAINIAVLLFTVDVVLGPVLTFIVYQKNKKSLLFDLSLIFLVQISALAYGLSQLYGERPAYIVFEAGQFYIMPEKTLDTTKLQNSRFEADQAASLLVYTAMPSDISDKREHAKFINTNHTLKDMPQHYYPLKDNYAQVIKHKLEFDGKAFNRPVDAYYIHGKGGRYILLLDSESLEIIAVVAE